MSDTPNPSGSMLWYRGESTNAPPAKAGGHLHDFGEAVYFTSQKAVAEKYADVRVHTSGGTVKVYEVAIQRAELGRVLDLTNDPRWRSFMNTPLIPGRMDRTPEKLIRLANENYASFFQQFLQRHKIDIRQYDAVVGPEFVRGGNQLALLHKNGQPSQIAVRIRAAMVPVGGVQPSGKVAPVNLSIPSIPGDIFVPKSTARRIAGNQGAVAAAGVALGAGIQRLGDYGIQRHIESELTTTHVETIRAILARGQGVLVIINLQEWERPNDIGMRARTFLAMYLQGGSTQADALQQWDSQPRLLQGPPKGWRIMTQHLWIEPNQ
jgi:hypothetical protein